MRKRKNRKISSSSISSNLPLKEQTETVVRLPDVSPPPTLKVRGAEEFLSLRTYEVQVTVRSLVELSRNQVSKLAGFALSEVRERGIGLTDWFILEYLYSYLLGSKLDPLERNNKIERELSLLLKIVLLSGTWIKLSEEKSILSDDINLLIDTSPFVPKGRSKFSWKETWKLEKFLEIRLVPLDLFLERSKGTVPYSSYCKGYGEGRRMDRKQRLPPSPELDGEPVDLEEESSLKINLLDLSRLLDLVQIEAKYLSKKK